MVVYAAIHSAIHFEVYPGYVSLPPFLRASSWGWIRGSAPEVHSEIIRGSVQGFFFRSCYLSSFEGPSGSTFGVDPGMHLWFLSVNLEIRRYLGIRFGGQFGGPFDSEVCPTVRYTRGSIRGSRSPSGGRAAVRSRLNKNRGEERRQQRSRTILSRAQKYRPNQHTYETCDVLLSSITGSLGITGSKAEG